jgi:hypothetical protein
MWTGTVERHVEQSGDDTENAIELDAAATEQYQQKQEHKHKPRRKHSSGDHHHDVGSYRGVVSPTRKNDEHEWEDGVQGGTSMRHEYDHEHTIMSTSTWMMSIRREESLPLPKRKSGNPEATTKSGPPSSMQVKAEPSE